MEYNDEKLLSVSEYETMAKAYSKNLRDKGFIFVQVDSEQNEAMLHEIFVNFLQLKSSLFFLGGFLNTGKLYSLNERHFKIFQTLYPEVRTTETFRVRGDKTKCFLNMISLESKLISSLLSLTDQSPYHDQLERMIYERLATTQSIFNVQNVLQLI